MPYLNSYEFDKVTVPALLVGATPIGVNFSPHKDYQIIGRVSISISLSSISVSQLQSPVR